jgi:type I restriction enzyme R subunit
MENAFVKTIARFLNTDGGTLFIGVDDQHKPITLHRDTRLVKPPNVDGLVNWLTTHLVSTLTHAAVMRSEPGSGWMTPP